MSKVVSKMIVNISSDIEGIDIIDYRQKIVSLTLFYNDKLGNSNDVYFKYPRPYIDMDYTISLLKSNDVVISDDFIFSIFDTNLHYYLVKDFKFYEDKFKFEYALLYDKSGYELYNIAFGNNNFEKIYIPDKHDGIDVKRVSLGSTARNKDKIKEVFFHENSAVKIISWAFGMWASLEKVFLPDSLETIAEYSFRRCTNLKSISIPQGVKEIGSFSFEHCENLEDVFFLGNGKIELGYCAFTGCKKLTNVFINSKNIISLISLDEERYSMNYLWSFSKFLYINKNLSFKNDTILKHYEKNDVHIVDGIEYIQYEKRIITT